MQPTTLTRSLIQENYQLQNAAAAYAGEWNDVVGRVGSGRQTFQNGEFYEGEFLDNAFCGQGFYQFADGSSYQGQFEGGLFHGHGVLKAQRQNGIDVYEGEFAQGKRHGNFSVQYANGNQFVGQYENDVKVQGQFVYADSSTYQGPFVNNRFEGKGCYKSPDFEYQGGFKHHMRAGNGTETTSDFVYSGKFEADRAHGTGKFKCQDGLMKSQWVDGAAK